MSQNNYFLATRISFLLQEKNLVPRQKKKEKNFAVRKKMFCRSGLHSLRDFFFFFFFVFFGLFLSGLDFFWGVLGETETNPKPL